MAGEYVEMKKLGILLAWDNFSEYYSQELANVIAKEYETTITYDPSTDFTDYDVVMSFFPERDPITRKNNVVKLFWEYNEIGMNRGKVNIACSTYTYRMLLEADPNALYIPLGINTDHFSVQPFPEGKPIIGWAGSITNARKRIGELTACINSTGFEFKPNKAVWTGNGMFNGPIPLKDTNKMWQYYKTIHIYVCGSYAEGFGLPLLEAASCGRPIVTFDVGITSELLHDGAGVIIVNDWDDMRYHVKKLAEDPKRILRLGENSAKAVRSSAKWLWAHVYGRWLEAFRKAEEK